MTTQATYELIAYVPASVRADLLPAVRSDWPTADGALPVAALLERVSDETAQARVRAAARDFEARVLEVVGGSHEAGDGCQDERKEQTSTPELGPVQGLFYQFSLIYENDNVRSCHRSPWRCFR